MAIFEFKRRLVDPGKRPWGKEGLGYTVPFLYHDYTISSYATNPYTHQYYNPIEGDIILITAHNKDATINSISYGGVEPTLLIKNDDDWPQTYLYAIPRDSQPATGENHNLEVNWSESNTGATSFTKLGLVKENVLSDLSLLPVATTYESSSSSIETLVSIEKDIIYFIFDCATFREGTSGDPDSGQHLLFQEDYEDPRWAGASCKIVEGLNSESMGWSYSGDSDRIRHCVVAIPIASLFNIDNTLETA